ncbi:hypothetical protein D3OALGA1CA_2679 [Olavius algarvensis associated proteobacterium Delta 3]|nr:hypothetical protein D3OALGB2SA_2629 [Olavius algarvensis associated proteobacterium Delta 3]CAB5122687.1 hypothetical protein D3OALGA1CA_2679 [Olavius algarvensis associated proteobacterium Delta 3]
MLTPLIKRWLLFTVLIASLYVSPTIGYGAIFEDTFANQGFTVNNWMNTGGNWTFPADPPNTYRGTWDGLSFAAATLANSGKGYFQSNLSLQTTVALGYENSAAGLWLTFDEQGNYVYQISIISGFIQFGGQDKLVLSRVKDKNPLEFAILNLDPPANGLSINTGTFYTIEAAIDDQNVLSVTLLDPGRLPGEQSIAALVWNLTNDPEFAAGVPNSVGAGIFAQDDATFDSFTLNGTPIPIPKTSWLLGFGILCVLGVRKTLTPS